MPASGDDSSRLLFPSPPAVPDAPRPDAPLADPIRPRTLEEILGQDEVLGPGKPLRRAIESDYLRSLILWGPPGSGKTTLAHVIRLRTRHHFESMSAVLTGVKELKEVLKDAEVRRKRDQRRTIVFIDEIHRYNKAQQDALLSHVESGDVVLIGATTENPSFEVNAALLSRCRVVVLKPLGAPQLIDVLRRALTDPERGLGAAGADVADDALEFLRSEEHTSELQSLTNLVCRLLPAPPFAASLHAALPIWGHHREPVVRGERGPPVTLPRRGLETARGPPAHRRASAGPHRPGARPRRRRRGRGGRCARIPQIGRAHV